MLDDDHFGFSLCSRACEMDQSMSSANGAFASRLCSDVIRSCGWMFWDLRPLFLFRDLKNTGFNRDLGPKSIDL